jgi:glucan-binding YG repeat protein
MYINDTIIVYPEYDAIDNYYSEYKVDDNFIYYSVDSSGRIKKANGWIKVNRYRELNYETNSWCQYSEWLYASDGKLTKNAWVSSGNNNYYLDSNGAMAIGTRVIDGKTYLFNENGILVNKSGWSHIRGKWYYTDNAGTIFNGRVLIGNQYYMFDDNEMRFDYERATIYTSDNSEYCIEDSGAIRTKVGFYQRTVKEYYEFEPYILKDVKELVYVSDSEGHPSYRGWITVNGNNYYIDYNGKVVTGVYWIYDQKHIFDSEGRFIGRK